MRDQTSARQQVEYAFARGHGSGLWIMHCQSKLGTGRGLSALMGAVPRRKGNPKKWRITRMNAVIPAGDWLSGMDSNHD